MTALQLSGPEANTARQPGQEEEEMETERKEEVRPGSALAEG
jgi:hypothetical protein